jgi:hypothetical protein
LETWEKFVFETGWKSWFWNWNLRLLLTNCCFVIVLGWVVKSGVLNLFHSFCLNSGALKFLFFWVNHLFHFVEFL